MKSEKTYILSVLVNNNFGVLTRIAGLFARRGYNIRSLTVGETLDERISRMTIECIGDDYALNQIQCQLLKVEDVLSVTLLSPENSVCRELFLVCVHSPYEKLKGNFDEFDCRVLSAGESDTVFEVCGTSKEFEEFCKKTKNYGNGVPDVSRTGITAISK